jgi:hypothetical protein
VLNLEEVFKILQRDKWRVKLTECSFAQRHVTYLGYVISGDGVSTYPGKIKAVMEWPVPKSVKDLRSFLGLVG